MYLKEFLLWVYGWLETGKKGGWRSLGCSLRTGVLQQQHFPSDEHVRHSISSMESFDWKVAVLLLKKNKLGVCLCPVILLILVTCSWNPQKYYLKLSWDEPQFDIDVENKKKKKKKPSEILACPCVRAQELCAGPCYLWALFRMNAMGTVVLSVCNSATI